MVLGADLHRHFDRSELFVFGGHNADLSYVSDVNPVQSHRSPNAQTLCIVEVGFDHDPWGEQARSPGHEKQQKSERQAGDDDRDPNAQFRPLELLLARQKTPS